MRRVKRRVDSTRVLCPWDLRTPPTLFVSRIPTGVLQVAVGFLKTESLSLGRFRSYLVGRGVFGNCTDTVSTFARNSTDFFHGRRTRVGRVVVEDVHREGRADLRIQRACVCFVAAIRRTYSEIYSLFVWKCVQFRTAGSPVSSGALRGNSTTCCYSARTPEKKKKPRGNGREKVYFS